MISFKKILAVCLAATLAKNVYTPVLVQTGSAVHSQIAVIDTSTK